MYIDGLGTRTSNNYRLTKLFIEENRLTPKPADGEGSEGILAKYGRCASRILHLHYAD